MISTIKLKRITIIFQDNLEERLARDLKALGTKGYTVDKVRGSGLDGFRGSEWEGENIRLVTVCAPQTANKILEHLQQHYFDKYAGIVYMSDVEVVRGERFV
jgi:nitrogen regulatory protein P-II 2